MGDKERLDFYLHKFDNISLSQMQEIRLMRRVDKKFIIPKERLPQLLEKLARDYYVQEINGIRVFEYATLYYDTLNYEMYEAHQNGKLNRLKVRTREYVDSQLCFLEIKQKSNKGITKKTRIVRKALDSITEEKSSLFLSSETPYHPESLEGKIRTLYHRITLVNKGKTERLTIDLDLSFIHEHTKRKISLPDLVVIELKKDQLSYSPVMESLGQWRIKAGGMSKYCLGVALTESGEEVKKNRFKQKLRYINKITAFQYE